MGAVTPPGFKGRLPDGQLSPFLVDFAGVDLLSYKEVRKKLTMLATPPERDDLHEFPSSTRGRSGPESVAQAVADRRWHPGKAWARHFAKTLGFPATFAGFPGSPVEPDSIEIQPFRRLPALADFQTELLPPMREVFASATGSNRAILTLPTGAGKTRTTVEAIFDWYRQMPELGTILWIAQSEELCEQAVQAFREVWVDLGHRDASVRETLQLGRLWGGRGIPEEANIVVASIQQLYSIVSDEESNRRGELADLAGDICLVVIDEAHQIPAPSYTKVLAFLGINVSRGGVSDIPLLGLTATPFRGAEGETRALVNRFNGRLIRPLSLSQDPVADLRSQGVLAHPDHEILLSTGAPINLDANSQFREYFDRFGDFPPELLGDLGEESGRNKQILDRICEIPADWPSLFFGCSVEHATAVAVLLRRRGRTAATVTGETRAATRRAIIEEFRAGRIGTLCNYGVLTTGFDAPTVKALVISRPHGQCRSV